MKHKNKYLLILCAWLFCACSSSKEITTSEYLSADLESLNLKGPVKTQGIYTSTYDLSNDNKELFISHLVTNYSPTGKILDQTDYNMDHEARTRTTYHYNEQAKLLEERTTNYYGDTYKLKKYEYDEKANLVAVVSYATNEDSPAKVQRYIYDKRKKKLLEEQFYDTNNVLESRLVYTYGKKKRKLKEQWLSADGSSTKEILYNEMGKVQSIAEYPSNEKYKSKLTSKRYSEWGQLLEQEIQYDGEAKERILYLYNAQNKLIEKQYRMVDSKELKSLVTYSYDDAGNRTEQLVMLGNDKELELKLSWAYNSLGQKVKEEKATSHKGKLEKEATKTFSYDAQNNINRIGFYLGGGCVEEQSYELSYY